MSELELDDTIAMNLAIGLAKQAETEGEVPVGAVILHKSSLVASGYNRTIGLNDPTAHAEIQVIRSAATVLKNYRLTGATLYVTLEPCPMCAGAIIQSRIERVIFGAYDENSGSCGSVFDILQNKKLNHQVKVIGGIEEERCAEILKAFFGQRRGKGG